MEPNPLETHTQLPTALQRLGYRCYFRVICDLFGVAIGSEVATVNKALREMFPQLFNGYLYMPTSEEEQLAECKGFVENYELLCVGVWNGFHVHVSTDLKNYCSFRNRYSITNMGLIGCNKRFLYLTAGAPGSTHDAHLLR